ERALAGLMRLERERSMPRAELISLFIGTGHVQRRLEARDHPVPSWLQRIRPQPSAVVAKDLMVGRTDQSSSVLKDQGHALAGTSCPRSTAFLASRPAAIITLGFDVFVHDVIAAITTAPCPRVAAW